ncbi:MAG: hypothetical protein ACXWPM_07495, partial [Bdellovibrionota bacterium]
GNIDFSCDKQPGQKQSTQVQFQQSQQQSGPTSCKPQFQFQNSKMSDFDMNLDCTHRQVVVQNKGIDTKGKATLPIQSDGKVKGQMQFQQQAQDDGKGNQVCWIEFVVDFDGQALCDNDEKLSMNTQVQFQQVASAGGSPGMAGIAASASPSPEAAPVPEASVFPEASPAATPTSSPSASAVADVTIRIPSGAPNLGSLAFGDTRRIQPGQSVMWINDDSTEHTVTADDGSFDSGPIAPGGNFVHVFDTNQTVNYHCSIHTTMTGILIVGNASPNALPGMSPTPSPSPVPSPSVSPSPHPHPSPIPTVTVVPTPVVVCAVSNPCPVINKTDLNCPSSQSAGSAGGMPGMPMPTSNPNGY